jgi:type I restriction enzyme M protein
MPNIPSLKDSMKLFIRWFVQHIMYAYRWESGNCSIHYNFITASKRNIERKIREQMVERKMLRGVVSMPSNIFATTGTNVFYFCSGQKEKIPKAILLMDASNQALP